MNQYKPCKTPLTTQSISSSRPIRSESAAHKEIHSYLAQRTQLTPDMIRRRKRIAQMNDKIAARKNLCNFLADTAMIVSVLTLLATPWWMPALFTLIP